MRHLSSNKSINIPPQEQSTAFAQIKRVWQSILLGKRNSSTTTVATKTMAVNHVNGTAVQPQSPVKLDVIVVGAGISGLATAISSALSGHNVTVFESAKELLEVSCLPAWPLPLI